MLEPMPFELMRWLEGDVDEIRGIYWGTSAKYLETRIGEPCVAIQSEWNLGYLKEKHPNLVFHDRADWRTANR
jgi:peptide subunit release factor RF-3